MAEAMVHLVRDGIALPGYETVVTKSGDGYLFMNGECMCLESIAKVLIEEGLAKRAPASPIISIPKAPSPAPSSKIFNDGTS